MTVPVQNPYNSYNANGSTTQFRYEFLIKDASDLSVTLDGAVVDKSKYTLTNVGQSNGGDVTFSTAPVAGLLIIRRSVIAQRLTDYQDNGPLRAEDVNRDFDRVVMMIQDKQADADTALKHPLGQNGTSTPYTYDANGGRIIDLGTPTADTDAATKKYVDDLYVDKAAQAVRQAEAARDAAVVSANAAAASQQSASSSQSAASGSQSAAKTSETNAANSASAAAASASAAAGSASIATTAAGTATGAATTATQASSGATQRANQASASATAAGQSATAAAGSATTAGQQAGAAAGSATAAFNAQKAAELARDQAINVAPGNYMLKTNNLSDLVDKSVARATLNVQGAKCVTSTAPGAFNALSSPDDKLNLLIANSGTWGVQSVEGVIKPLVIGYGGTGATDAPGARRNIGGKWEETQQYLNSEAIALRRPNAITNQWIAFYRETNNAAFRFGHEPNDQLVTHSYNTDGTYRKKINQISANGDTSIFGGLSLEGDLTSAGEGVIGRISIHRNRYPQVNLWSSDRTDVGAYLRIEIPSQVGSAPYLYQMVNKDNASNGVLTTLPRTTGVLAVQGTSGREYKKDITTADSAEALARITSLELVNFVYKDDEQERIRFGIIAEDVEKIAPQYVKHNQLPIPGTEIFDDEGNKIREEYQDRPSIDNNPIVMDLLGCIQNLQMQINDLKKVAA